MFSILVARPVQTSLFGRERPGFDAEFGSARRRRLSRDAWLEHAPSWLSGHETLFEGLLAGADWHLQRRHMYDREVDVPRLLARLPESGAAPLLLREVADALSQRYGRTLGSIALAYYRDGNDSVAPHGDKMGALRPDTVIAILSLGEPRRFTLRAIDGSLSLAFALGWGDLLVMGGSCQETFLHGIPKVKNAGPRMSVQFRERLPPSVQKTYADDITSSVPVAAGR